MRREGTVLKKIRVFVVGAGAIAMGLLILVREQIGAFQDVSDDVPLDEMAFGMIAVGILFLLMLFTEFGKRLALFVMFGAIAGACFYYVSTYPFDEWAWQEYSVGALGLVFALNAIMAPFGLFSSKPEPDRQANPSREFAASATKKAVRDWLED